MRGRRTTGGRAQLSRAARASFALAIPAAIFISCGARTGLHTDAGTPPPPPRSGFCARAEYRAGYSNLSIYVLLDKSASMANDHKWDQATAALSAFVGDPATSGLGVGLGYFPIGASCDPEAYALPAVPIAALPGNATKITTSLAAQNPDGQTPTRLALRSAIEYARARQIGNPHEEVAVVLVTDGVPNACNSTVDNVAAVARDGVTKAPQVLTFVIGQPGASESGLEEIAAAGGTGKPIIVGSSPDSAQKLVDALQTLREALASCRYAIPDAGQVALEPSDVAVSYMHGDGSPDTTLARVAGASDCGSMGGFYVDDPASPSQVELCPTVCHALQAEPGSQVRVIAGCGGHSEGGVTEGGTTGGTCSSVVSFSCTPKCGTNQLSPAVCEGGLWTCPAGMVQTDSCTTCAIVPHGCCKTDGTVGVASCINGAWVCPPGAAHFGDPGCRPPEVCTELMSCGPGQYCKVPDYTCGTGSLPGKCEPIPSSCPASDPVCGCGGTTYPSQCAAAAAGVDLSIAGNCSAPAGTFACGPYFCKAGSEICRHTLDLTKKLAQSSYACITPPAGCASGCGCHQCNCPAGKVCKESCATSGGARLLTCTAL